MKNIITTPVSTAYSLNIATRWALGGLAIAIAVMAMLTITA